MNIISGLKYLIKIYSICLLPFASLAQQLPVIIKFQTENIDPKNLNLLELNVKFKKTINQEKARFIKGFIIKNLDTINCEILKGSKGLRINPYLEVVARYNDSIHIYSAKEIEGYGFEKKFYKSHTSLTNSFKNFFFIELISSGKIMLYKRESLASHPGSLYYFLTENNPTLYTIDPYEQNISIDNEKQLQNAFLTGRSDRIFYLNSKNIPEKFKAIFSDLLGDCIMVRNKILSGFYEVTDFESVIKEYNKCF